MSEEGSNPISKQIGRKLAGLARTSNRPFIFRVDPILRKENDGAYEPQMLSIGPYHHGKNNLQKMEKYKLKSLQQLLERRGESSADRYITALMKVEEEARNCYAEHINLSQADFVEMLLLDGCFIIALLQKCLVDDPIFKMKWFRIILLRDLLVFDNQLPFFILQTLFEMTKNPNQEADLIHLAISSLYRFIANDKPTEPSYKIGQEQNILHLLNLIYLSWCSSIVGGMQTEDGKHRSRSPDQNRSDFSVITCFQKKKVAKNFEFIKSVVELKEHGIEFRKAKQSKSWLHINFENGVLEIPRLVTEDKTEPFLRNLIAYEQYMSDLGYSRNLVIDYLTFMNCVINSEKDVKILRHQGIIENWLGCDEAVAKMFNKIGNNVFFSRAKFSYADIFKEVNEHCSEPWNTWRAHLKRNYFSNPCTTISILAATLLLLLTVLQTVFSILQL